MEATPSDLGSCSKMAPFSVAEAVREISICRPSSVSVVEMAIERASAEAALCRGPLRSLHARQQEEEKDFSPWRRSEEEETWRASDASALDAEEAKENDSLADDPLLGDSFCSGTCLAGAAANESRSHPGEAEGRQKGSVAFRDVWAAATTT